MVEKDLEARVEALEARLSELEDVRVISEVFRRWNYACTGGFNGIQAGRMEALDCLTDDATIEIEGLHEPGEGPRGREEYTAYWEFWFGDNGPLPYVFQSAFDETIEVDGDAAVQYCNFLLVAQLRDGTPNLRVNRRVNYFVRTPDGWKINKTTGDSGFYTPLPGIAGETANQLPPQEARTSVHMGEWMPRRKVRDAWPYRRTDTGI